MIKPLWEHILYQALLRPSALAVWGPGGPIAYQALAHDVDGLATELLERGLTRQDVVGIEMGFSYLHVLLILALDRLSIPSMSFVPRQTMPASAAALMPFGVTAIVSGDASPAAPPCRWLTMPEQHRPRLGAPGGALPTQLDAPTEGLVRLIFSSGTTGGPKGSPVTRAIQHHRIVNRRLTGGFGPRTRLFTGMPFSSNPGYVRLIAVLAAGGAVILPSPELEFAEVASMLGVTTAAGTPAMLAELLGRSGTAVRRLDGAPTFEVLGDHLPAKLAQDARLFLTPNLYNIYGATETDQVTMADATVCIADPSAAGFLMPAIEAEIVDDADRLLPAGREGRLRVRGSRVIAGYFRNATATQRNFCDGWFYPGDLGEITADGLLRITGRVEDVVVRDGARVSPAPLEDAIRSVRGVRDTAVFGLDGADGAAQLCAALVLEPGTDAASVRAAVTAQLGAQAPARVFVVDALPRNAAGKVQRRALAEMARRSVKA